MKSRQRKQHMATERRHRKAAKAAKKQKCQFKASNTRFNAISVQKDKSHVEHSARQNPVHKSIGGNSFLQLLNHWHPPQSDRKVIPFPVFQSNRKARIAA